MSTDGPYSEANAVLNEMTQAPEVTGSREVEYSPISGWFLVAVGLVICGFLAWILADGSHVSLEPAGKVRVAIDINHTTVEELQILPRIGPALASRIVEYTRQHGPVTSLEQLYEVRGLGARMIEDLAPYLIFPTTLPDAQAVAVHDYADSSVVRQE